MTTNIPASASSPQDFKKKVGAAQLIELPSGLWVTAKKVNLQDFIRSGQVPNMLMSIVNEAIKAGDGDDATTAEEAVKGMSDLDIDQLREMYDMIDASVLKVMVNPTVMDKPENEADRLESQLYIDEIEDQDKLYLFEWATGAVADLETFRKESSANVAALEKVSIARSEAESDAGSSVG